MRRPPLRVLLLTLFIAIIHFVACIRIFDLWSDANAPPIDWRSASFSLALTVLTFPVELVLPSNFRFGLTLLFINSLLWAAILTSSFLFLVRRPRLLLVTAFGCLIVVPALWYAGATAVAAFAEKRLASAWERAFPNRQSLAQRWPRRGRSQSADEVTKLAAEATIQLAMVHSVSGDIRAHLFRQIRRPDAALDAPPAEVKSYLTAYRWELREIERYLVGGDAPAWELDLDRLDVSPVLIPYNVATVLSAEALEAHRLGDGERAAHLIAAATPLVRELQNRPDSAAPTFAVVGTTLLLGAARKIGPPAIIEPLRYAPHQLMIDVQEVEARAIPRMLAQGSSDDAWKRRPLAERILLSLLVRPYLRLCAVRTAQSHLRSAIFIRDYSRCRFQSAAVEERRRILPFAPIDSVDLPVRATTRANRLLLDYEGTEKILQLRGEGIPGRRRELSRSFCRRGRWLLSGGIVQFTLPVAEKEGGLPTRYEFITAPRRVSPQTSSATPRPDRVRG